MNRRELAQAITLVESTNPEDQEKAYTLLDTLEPATSSFRIGVSGVPGAGKSTFIDSFGSLLIEKGHRVAVLAIDPSSPLTHGSILADKTRMMRLSSSPDAFIRPTPSSGVLGGVSARTREVTLLCEAAGYDIILIETVGIGQSEIQISSLTDAVLLLIPPAAGDELQGIKKGIVEIADILLINKNDGDLKPFCDQAFNVYTQALKLTSQRPPPLHKISSKEGYGLEVVWKDLSTLKENGLQNGKWEMRRQSQGKLLFEEIVREEVWRQFKARYGEQMTHLTLDANQSALKRAKKYAHECFEVYQGKVRT